jgi:hypothetical protein
MNVFVRFTHVLDLPRFSANSPLDAVWLLATANGIDVLPRLFLAPLTVANDKSEQRRHHHRSGAPDSEDQKRPMKKRGEHEPIPSEN